MAKERSQVETIEEGNIYFSYRPRVEREEPHGSEDVQNLYLVLSPRGKRVYRLVIIGRQRLPEPKQGGKSRMWGFVSMVAKESKKIVDELGAVDYQTKTRGERHQPRRARRGRACTRSCATGITRTWSTPSSATRQTEGRL